MTRYHCSMCNRCFHPSYQTFCMHPENYSEIMDTYEYETDAGYTCPLNIAQDDYVSLIDEQLATMEAEKALEDQMKEMGIVSVNELVDEEGNSIYVPSDKMC